MVESFPIAGTETIVDLGAGNIELASALIRKFPACKPILVDLPHETTLISERLTQAGLETRVAVRQGDLTKDAPPPADLYLLCRVLLNFDDARLKAVLSRCRKVMREDALLLIAEPLMPPPGDARQASYCAHDLHLWAMWGGKQRTADEYGRLLKETGFHVMQNLQARAGHEIICDVIVAGASPD